MDKIFYKILYIFIFFFLIATRFVEEKSTIMHIIFVILVTLVIVFGVLYILSYLLSPLKYFYWKFATPNYIIKKIQKGFDINKVNKEGVSPFMMFCFHNNIQVVQAIIQYGVDLEKRNKQEKTILHQMLEREENLEMLKLLINNKADVNAKDYTGWTPLMYACANDCSIDIITTLIESSANINAKDDEENSVLIFACKHIKNPEVIKILLDKGADRTVINKNGKIALDYALKNSYLKSNKIIEYLKD